MKLIIPSECQIGSLIFEVCWNDDLLRRLDLVGQINSKDQRLRLAHRKSDQNFLNLIHEAIHGICMELGIESYKDNPEAFTDALSTGITIFLRSLGIEPDFSQIKEEEL